jgi:hypothetical protein
MGNARRIRNLVPVGVDENETINDYTDVELIWTAMVPYGYKLITFEDE